MKKVLKIIGLSIIGIFIAAAVGFIIWAKLIYKAEPEKLATATDAQKNNYSITEKPD